MGNKATNLLGNIKETCSPDIFEKAENILCNCDKATPAKQGKYIKSCMEMLIQENQNIASIMRKCNCLSESTIKKAKLFYAQSSGNLDLFLSHLNQNHIGGGKLRYEGNVIIGTYDTCYCGVPKATKGMPSSYCECSAGWFERLFSEVFEKKVTVARVQTIVEGFDRCVFEIQL
ncbi:MAG: hypothetical protein K0S47_1122 [Herbinix sp.]|jgi:predicted hydrocarbon binding protein|nr:hypothetical protein [Herbinix sp.]